MIVGVKNYDEIVIFNLSSFKIRREIKMDS